MTKAELSKILLGTKYRDFAHNISEIEINGTICKDLFRIEVLEKERKSIKIRNQNSREIEFAIENALTVLDENHIINKPIDVMRINSKMLIISNWIEGAHFCDDSQSRLPDFFVQLARFNLANRSSKNFTSMYLDNHYFNDVNDLIAYEKDYLLSFWVSEKWIKEINDIFEIMKEAIPCVINEDVNLGNMIEMENGEFRVIDIDWLQNGLNLYQFDHMNLLNFEKEEWFRITNIAKECFTAYFREIPISFDMANEQIRAIEILRTLRKNTYRRFFKQSEYYGSEIEEIERIINIKTFI